MPKNVRQEINENDLIVIKDYVLEIPKNYISLDNLPPLNIQESDFSDLKDLLSDFDDLKDLLNDKNYTSD